MDTNDVDRIHRELDQVRAALRSPKIGLLSSRKLYRRLDQLYRELDRAELDLAIDHVSGEPNETILSSRPTIYLSLIHI